MAETLTRFNVSININALKKNVLDLERTNSPLLVSRSINFTHGTGANQANQFWTDNRTVAPTTADNIDLAGVLVSSLGIGATITFTKVKGIFVFHNTPDADADMLVGGHATAALADMFAATPDLDTAQPSLKIKPGGWLPLVAPNAAGYIVTATSEDMLRIFNGASAPVNYDIVILGCV